MPANPELIRLDILITYDQVAISIEMDDRRELLHLETLRIRPAQPLPIHHDVGRIDRCGIY